MKLSTSTNLFGKQRDGRNHTPYIESVRRCRKAGFTTLDFSFCEFFFTHTELHEDDWLFRIDEIKNEAEKLGITFTQSHLPYNPGYMPEWESQKQLDDYYKFACRGVLASSILGVKCAIVHPFTQCSQTEYDDEASVRYNQEFYAPIIELAMRENVGIAYENMIEYPQRRKFSARAEELAELVDSYRDPRIGACWDFGHGNRMYHDLSRPVRVLGKRLVALHVNDNTAISDLHLPPFLGTVNWEMVMRALKETGYAGDFTYEIYGFTKLMPEPLKDAAAKMAYEIGMYCLSRFDKA